MNKCRRKEIKIIIDRLHEVREDLEPIRDEETEYRDGIPENLQTSEKYERADEAVCALDNAVDSFDEIISYLESAME